MTTDKLDLLGPSMAEIGNEAVHLAGGTPDGIFLYVEIGDGWIGLSLFKDEGATLRYIDLDESTLIDDLITDAWHLEPADKRWTTMQYTIDRGKFGAEFDYENLESSVEGVEDRRERILKARYGDKPVTYPPMPSDSWTLAPSD